MAAYDNAPMPSAPGAMSYGAGLVNFTPLGDLADSYFKGQKEQRAEKVASAFKDGLPTDDKGQPDYNAMAAKLFQLGDYGGGTSLANTGIARQQLQVGNDLVKGPIGQISGAPGQTGQAPSAPQMLPSLAASPASAAVSGGSPTGYNGGDNGQNTVASVVMAKMPPELAGPAINRIAGRLGIDPNQPLNQDQLAKVGLGLTAEGLGTPTGGPVPGAPPQAMAQAAPQDQTQVAPREQAAIANGEKRLEGMTPERRIQWLSQVAASPAVPKSVNEWASKRLEAEYAAVKPTTEMQNAAASGVSTPAELKLREEQDKDATTRYGKKYEAISKAGSEAAVELPQLQIAKQIMSDPNFYSGPGEGLNKAYKRLLATIGGDPNSAQPQEAFAKVISNSILSQIRSMAGTGPVRVAEIRIMERAVASHDNTPAANRTLVEMSTRLHQHALAIDNIARNYKNGRLDPGFDTAVREYEQQHPLFTPQELKDPRALGAPTFATPQAAVAAGFPSGSPIRTPDGRIKYLP